MANNAKAIAKACISTKVTEFKSKSSVSGATSGENTTAGTTSYFFVDNCSPVDGCEVQFKHEMKSSGSHGSTDWQVSRTSNADSLKDGKAVADNSNVGKGTFTYNDNYKIVQGPSEKIKLYPGVVVCEKISYKPSNDVTKTVSKTYTEVCASALGDAQPDDPPGSNDPEDPNTPSGNGAFINIKVRNESLNAEHKYSLYRKAVYAKPGDNLKYRASYNPTLQYTYYLKPQQMKIVGPGANNAVVTNTNKTQLGALFNANKGNNLNNWNNAFSIQRADNSKDPVKFGYNPGVTSLNAKQKADQIDEYKNVSQSKVGTAIIDKAITNLNDTTRTTPQQVTFVRDGNNLGEVNVNQKESSASAYVPYNFVTEAKIDDDSSTIGAGESKPIMVDINLLPRSNTETMNATDISNKNKWYVTKADNVLRKLVVYVPNNSTPIEGGGMDGDRDTDICNRYYGLPNNETSCGYSNSVTNNLPSNPPSNSSISDLIPNKEKFTFYAQDAPAGSRVCVAVAVFPANSGNPDNWNDTKNYNGAGWAISQSKCFTIIKKPALQAWGGNVFTQSGIAANRSIKKHLDGKNNYSVKEGSSDDANSYIYGSWGELGVISGGPVIEFASGAATGYQNSNGGKDGLVPRTTYFGDDSNPGSYKGLGNNDRFYNNPGGLITKSETDFKFSSRLTVPNSDSGGGVTLNNSNDSIASQIDNDRNTVISKLIPDIGDDYGNDTLVKDSLDGRNRYSAENVTVETAWASEPGMRVIYGKNVNIKGNITYDDNKTYKDLKEIPKIIIYAEKNINIDCSVWRIDALLIADNRVITCSDGYEDENLNNGEVSEKIENDINRFQNSNQLMVNGAIITKKLYANRTYGTATGANTIVPAEFINFDPTLYDFGKESNDNDDDSYGNLEVNYIRELSPRR